MLTKQKRQMSTALAAPLLASEIKPGAIWYYRGLPQLHHRQLHLLTLFHTQFCNLQDTSWCCGFAQTFLCLYYSSLTLKTLPFSGLSFHCLPGWTNPFSTLLHPFLCEAVVGSCHCHNSIHWLGFSEIGRWEGNQHFGALLRAGSHAWHSGSSSSQP